MPDNMQPVKLVVKLGLHGRNDSLAVCHIDDEKNTIVLASVEIEHQTHNYFILAKTMIISYCIMSRYKIVKDDTVQWFDEWYNNF